MRTSIWVAALAATMLVLCCFAAETDVPFYLAVTLKSRYNNGFTLCSAIRTDESFNVEWTRGNVRSSISGTLHDPDAGVYPLTLTVKQHLTDTDVGNSVLEGYKLKLGTPQHEDEVVSSAFNDTESRDVLLTQGGCPDKAADGN